MNAHDYYQSVAGRLKRCFRYSDYVVATGSELIAAGADPAFPATAEPLERLEELTVERGLQVHLPVIGKRSQSVLMPIDLELFLKDENHLLYTSPESQKALFSQLIPVFRFLENFFRSRGLPYLLDYTPSGCHILFHNLLGQRATDQLVEIGCLEEDLIRACDYRDPNDIRRRNGVSHEAARAFSGLGKLAEYISLVAMEAFKDNESRGMFPVFISDALDRSINFDNSWSEGSPFMRSIRSPFSLHKKNLEKYGIVDRGPLVDVIGACFDGSQAIEETDMDRILNAMWNLENAAKDARKFSGRIPCSNDTLIDLIQEYKASDLYRFHEDFDGQQDMPAGKALEHARRETRVPDWARDILYHPNPRAVQPKNMIGLIYDFLIRAKWNPKHIANILRDLYQNPSFQWTQDFFKYPAVEKANFWTRTYSAAILWKQGRLSL